MNIKNHITEILNYLEEDERKHFEESEEPEEHIYKDVTAVRNWLESPSCPLVDEEELN